MLSKLISQNDINIAQLHSKDKSKETRSNLFSEIKEGNSPSPYGRIEQVSYDNCF